MESAIPPSDFGRVFNNERLCGALLALAVHGSIFLGGSLLWMRRAEYGVDASNGMAEVDLVAAPAPMAATPASAISERQTPAQPAHILPNSEDVAQPEKTQTPTPLPAAIPVPNAILRTDNLNGPLGDGSSPVAGTDATTLHRAGSSGAYFKPGYFRNPPPPYPAEARRLKQEGRTLLEVVVTAQGTVGSAKIKQSSGYPLLDEAALRAVEHWRFRPAEMAGLRVETVAEVPIRFQLK